MPRLPEKEGPQRRLREVSCEQSGNRRNDEKNVPWSVSDGITCASPKELQYVRETKENGRVHCSNEGRQAEREDVDPQSDTQAVFGNRTFLFHRGKMQNERVVRSIGPWSGPPGRIAVCTQALDRGDTVATVLRYSPTFVSA